MAQYAVSNGFIGLGAEGSYSGATWTGNRGVASPSMKWIPITTPQVTPMQTFLRDEALRGSAVQVYDHVLGVTHAEYDAKCFLYADTFPVLVRSILGSTDAKTGASAPYTHSFTLLNDTSGSQPPSLTVQDFDGANTFQMLGSQASNLNITFGAEAAAEASFKLVGNLQTSITKPSATFSTEQFIPGWNITTTINSTSYSYVAEGEINIERNAAPIFTGGQINPRANFAGPINVSGRLTLVTDTTSDPFLIGGSALGLTDNPVPVVITMTDPVSSHAITYTMSATQFQDPKHNRGKAYVETEVSFTANANTTDSGGTGYSPIAISVTNGVSTYF